MGYICKCHIGSAEGEFKNKRHISGVACYVLLQSQPCDNEAVDDQRAFVCLPRSPDDIPAYSSKQAIGFTYNNGVFDCFMKTLACCRRSVHSDKQRHAC